MCCLIAFRLLGLFDCLDADDMDVYLDTLGSVLDLGGAKEVIHLLCNLCFVIQLSLHRSLWRCELFKASIGL